MDYTYERTYVQYRCARGLSLAFQHTFSLEVHNTKPRFLANDALQLISTLWFKLPAYISQCASEVFSLAYLFTFFFVAEAVVARQRRIRL